MFLLYINILLLLELKFLHLHLCIDYFKLTRMKKSLKIGNKSLKYTLGKLKKYINNYNTIFIVVINEESK